MELKIFNISISRKFVIVEIENIDKQFSVNIPKDEYRQWLKLGDLTDSDQNLENFAMDYINEIINMDDTANIILEDMYNTVGSEIKINDVLFNVHRGKFGYYMTRENSKVPHRELLTLYVVFIKAMCLPPLHPN